VVDVEVNKEKMKEEQGIQVQVGFFRMDGEGAMTNRRTNTDARDSLVVGVSL